jgi:hypothetical protein
MDVGTSRIIIETDSSNLATDLRSEAYDQSTGGVIYCEIRVLLALHFVLVDVCAIPRSCNKCAYELAHSGSARDLDVPSIWNDPLPIFVTVLVSRDLTDSVVE